MKAIGYKNWEIKGHYIIFSLLVGIGGALVGISSAFSYPAISLICMPCISTCRKNTGLYIKVISNAFLLSIAISAMAGWSAANSVTVIQPAESMRRKLLKSAVIAGWNQYHLFGQALPPWKMSIRSIRRNRERFIVTLLGVLFAITLMMMAFRTNDSVNYMMAKHFDLDRKYDLQVSFANPVKTNDLLN